MTTKQSNLDGVQLDSAMGAPLPIAGSNVGLDDAFFSTDSLAPVEMAWEPEPIPTMARSSRRAMQAALGMFATATVGIGAYLFYMNVVMPAPAMVGTAVAQAPAAMPMMEVAEEAEEVQEVEEVQELALPQEPTLEVAPAAEPEFEDAVPAVPDGAPSHARRPGKRRHAAKPAPKLGPLGKRAFALLNRGDFAAAERLAARSVVERPGLGRNWIVLGAARDALGDQTGARNAYRMCTSRAQDGALAHCRSLAHAVR